MPISLDPQATTEIYLDADEARPPEQRVAFLCRFITYRQRQRAYELAEKALAKDTPDAERYGLINQALAVGVIGPVGPNAKDEDGKPLPCTVESVWAVLTIREVRDLLLEYPAKLSLREDDRKKSESRPESGSATPAATAAKPASASTRRHRPSRS